MKKLSSIFIVGIILFIGGCNMKDTGDKVSSDKLEMGFVTPPDSIQTSVYWYWISDNISKEGVVNDLHAMKEVGINRAFIGNIGLDSVPYGKVKMLSEEWWEILHVALKTATELNIEIGIFNSPGWSQSGGPWVKAENAMRYLASSETRVKGPIRFSKKLEKPIEPFQDVKVIAYPFPKDNDLVLTHENGTISSSPGVMDLNQITDGNAKTGITFPRGDVFTIDFTADKAFTARSLSIQTTKNPMNARVLLQAQNESNNYSTVKEFLLNRSNPELHVGFTPYAPVIISFPAVRARKFRLTFTSEIPSDWAFPGINKNDGLAEVRLSSAVRIENYAEKSLAKMHPTPLPYWKDYLWKQQAEEDDKAFVIDSSKVLDISGFLSTDGTLNWDVPDGDWIIVRTGMTPTGTTNSPASPEATGYEVDKMSREHTELHFNGHIGEILRRIPEADRKTFKVVVLGPAPKRSPSLQNQPKADQQIQEMAKELWQMWMVYP